MNRIEFEVWRKKDWEKDWETSVRDESVGRVG